MSTNELAGKIRELKELQALIEEAEAEAETIRDQLKAQMGGQEEMRVDCYKLSWKPVKSARLDTKSLRAELPEVAARYTVETAVKRFCVA